MPRKNRPTHRTARPGRREEVTDLDRDRILRGAAWVVAAPDGSWHVRSVTASAAVKAYRCPGCDHEIAPGVPHVVVWPADDGAEAGWGAGRVDDRRHWHTPCWNARARRLR